MSRCPPCGNSVAAWTVDAWMGNRLFLASFSSSRREAWTTNGQPGIHHHVDVVLSVTHGFLRTLPTYTIETSSPVTVLGGDPTATFWNDQIWSRDLISETSLCPRRDIKLKSPFSRHLHMVAMRSQLGLSVHYIVPLWAPRIKIVTSCALGGDYGRRLSELDKPKWQRGLI